MCTASVQWRWPEDEKEKKPAIYRLVPCNEVSISAAKTEWYKNSPTYISLGQVLSIDRLEQYIMKTEAVRGTSYFCLTMVAIVGQKIYILRLASWLSWLFTK